MAAPEGITYKLKIIKIIPDPLAEGRTMVSLRISDDKEAWVRAYTLRARTSPISLEQFAHELKGFDLSKPPDPFVYLREAVGEEFEVVVGPKLEAAPDA